MQPNYFIRTDPEDFYGIPRVEDRAKYHPFNYRYGFGIRKLGRFGYEDKPNFYNGTESNVGLSAPTSSVSGFEYVLHWEKERFNGNEFDNKRLFIRHTGKYHIAKVESREQGSFDFSYKSGELRGRLPIGKKFSISAGAIYRTHERAYGYNPIEIWLNETEIYTNPNTGEEFEYPANPWYSLGYEYGYTDVYYTTDSYDPETGQPIEGSDWYWYDENNNLVAYSDLQFRNTVFRDLINRYNNEQWDQIDPFGLVSPIVGADFYHAKNNFWLHAYVNYMPPFHKYLSGDLDFSYLNRNNWGKGGLVQDAEPEQWEDYQFGINYTFR